MTVESLRAALMETRPAFGWAVGEDRGFLLITARRGRAWANYAVTVHSTVRPGDVAEILGQCAEDEIGLTEP